MAKDVRQATDDEPIKIAPTDFAGYNGERIASPDNKMNNKFQ